MEIHQCLSLGGSQYSSDGKERCSIKNFMSQMLILHLIYFPEMLVSEWKYYRLVSWLQEKKYIFHNQNQSSIKLHWFPRWKKCLIPQNHIGKWKKLCIPLIQKVRKSPLTKQKIWDVYAGVFEGLRTFPGESYKFKLKENHVPARHTARKVPIHLQDNFH